MIWGWSHTTNNTDVIIIIKRIQESYNSWVKIAVCPLANVASGRNNNRYVTGRGVVFLLATTVIFLLRRIVVVELVTAITFGAGGRLVDGQGALLLALLYWRWNYRATREH